MRVSVNTAIVQGKGIVYYISDSAICVKMEFLYNTTMVSKDADHQINLPTCIKFE